MPDFPYGRAGVLYTLCPWSFESIGLELYQTLIDLHNCASQAYNSANLANYIPFTLHTTETFLRAWTLNGAAAAGNLDIGIYTVDGTRLYSAGSTAQAGTNTLQTITCSVTLGPGRYYMAIAKDDTTGTIFRDDGYGAARQKVALGSLQQASAFPLPATATFAAPTDTVGIWCFGFSTRTVI